MNRQQVRLYWRRTSLPEFGQKSFLSHVLQTLIYMKNTCKYIYIYICIHTALEYICIYIYAYVHIYIYKYQPVFEIDDATYKMSVMCICIAGEIYLCTYIYIYIYIYSWSYINIQSLVSGCHG